MRAISLVLLEKENPAPKCIRCARINRSLAFLVHHIRHVCAHVRAQEEKAHVTLIRLARRMEWRVPFAIAQHWVPPVTD